MGSEEKKEKERIRNVNTVEQRGVATLVQGLSLQKGRLLCYTRMTSFTEWDKYKRTKEQNRKNVIKKPTLEKEKI